MEIPQRKVLVQPRRSWRSWGPASWSRHRRRRRSGPRRPRPRPHHAHVWRPAPAPGIRAGHPRPRPSRSTTPRRCRIPTELVEVHPGGVTAEQAGVRAAATSWNAKASEESVRGAAARVDEAWAAFLPRLSGIAKYTRLSNFTSPPFFSCAVGISWRRRRGPSTRSTPMPSRSSPLRVSVSVPLLRGQQLAPAGHDHRPDQRLLPEHRPEVHGRDALGRSGPVGRDGRAGDRAVERKDRVLHVAAKPRRGDRRRRRRSTIRRRIFATRETSSPSATPRRPTCCEPRPRPPRPSSRSSRPTNLSDLTEKQLRVAMHVPEGRAMLPGEDLETPVPPFQGNLQQMTVEALSARPEVKSADANAGGGARAGGRPPGRAASRR